LPGDDENDGDDTDDTDSEYETETETGMECQWAIGAYLHVTRAGASLPAASVSECWIPDSYLFHLIPTFFAMPPK